MMPLRLPGERFLDIEDFESLRPLFEADDLALASRNAVEGFESALAGLLNVPHAVAVSSGTAAVHLALTAAGVGPGDEVIVPSHTFVGSAAPIVHLGATPVFADVDERSFCTSVGELVRLMSPRTRAVIVVHLNGFPVDLQPIQELCRDRGVALIEDAAQALGTKLGRVAAGAVGDFSCFSFFAQKVVNSGGEGGAVVTSSEDGARRLRRLRSHGEELSDTRPGIIWSAEVGHNFRMTGLQALIGTRQLTELSDRVGRRERIAAVYNELLNDHPALQVPLSPHQGRHSYWKYALRLTSSRHTGERFAAALRARGIPSRLRYPVALHQQPAFSRHTSGVALPVAERLSEEVITLPNHPQLSNDDAVKISETLTSML